MKITKNSAVIVDYKLQKDDENGELIEQTHGTQPLSFIFGIGQMIPGFEANLLGQEEGASLAFPIPAAQAYGVQEKEAIIEVPIQSFTGPDGNIPDNIVEGQMINMQDKSGQSYQGRITQRKLDKVTVDFNHPMAGVNLYFSVEIKTVREATQSELDHGHLH
jgi:FKBP-type peptidyl-prolyl cis-trans isomerase SlyD